MPLRLLERWRSNQAKTRTLTPIISLFLWYLKFSIPVLYLLLPCYLKRGEEIYFLHSLYCFFLIVCLHSSVVSGFIVYLFVRYTL